ncbi:hypothetical protein B0H13DRAFT_2194387, partial [Mycena leptocephala]
MSTNIEGHKGSGAPPTRREAILHLVEMLLQQGNSDLKPNEQPSLEDVPSVDEHRQTAGAEAFHKFQKRIENLDKQLQYFGNATRHLGSSVTILSSAFLLRERIARILFLYRENTADLFPREVSHAPRKNVLDVKDESFDVVSISSYYSHCTLMNVPQEQFPEQFEALADNIVAFGRCLIEFPEFTDEAINASITSFEGDLRYWSSCLQTYRGQFRYPAVQRYVHDLTAEMGEHIDRIAPILIMFVEVGQSLSHHLISSIILNLSTVATFFSAVTATTLQFSVNLTGTTMRDSVNSFWFASLVFSIAAAVNSLLGVTWKQAMYRPPGNRVPRWVLIWIKGTPLVFLVISIACFSVGLCLFTFASQQNIVASTITTIFTIFTSFGLAAVSAYFASERYVFLRYNGRKWLVDVLLDLKRQFLVLPGINRTGRIWREFKGRLCTVKKAVAHFYKTLNMLSSQSSDYERSVDLEANILPVLDDQSRQTSAKTRVAPLQGVSETGPTSLPPSEPAALDNPAVHTTGSEAITTGPTKAKLLWKNAMKTIHMRSMAGPHRQQTSSSMAGERKRTLMDEPVMAISMRSRISTLRLKLLKLEATDALEAHRALVRDLQFSPDGKFLATSSWDRTSVIWRIEGRSLCSHRVLTHTQGFVNQVAWSDTGNILLTKLRRGMKVWTKVGRTRRTQTFIRRDGVCQKTIDRPTNVESITWFPGSQAFLSVEGNTVTKLDLRGNILDQYDFGRMKLHDVAVTPDGTRLLGVGPLLESPTGLHPSKSPGEKRFVVYNMELKQIEHQTPLRNDVRDVTLARNTRRGLAALISYENKAPPQLWRMELLKDWENPALLVARLTLTHTYKPKHAVDFAGPSYFGGKNDELVLCAGKAGDVHIWDREGGKLLRYISSAQLSGDLTCIAWNHAAEDLMFATGSHDGGVRIWTQ